MEHCLCVLDQGTTSTRCVLYNAQTLAVVAKHIVEHTQICPSPGLVEHDALELIAACRACLSAVVLAAGPRVEVLGVGLATQRETTVVWDKHSGRPLHNAVVWSDTRTRALCEALSARFGGRDAFARVTGLPISTYFSVYKLLWLIEHVPAVSDAVVEGRCCFGTVDSWLLYQLTGGKIHVTDATNASRTGLMDLRTCTWDASLCAALGVPSHVLPTIVSNAEIYGAIAAGPMAGVPLCASLGDQHAALLGHRCRPGEAKCTFGTGAFLLLNTGERAVFSQRNGLLTTLAWQLGPRAPPAYALEGSIAVAGAGVEWLRNNLGILSSTTEIMQLADSVPGSGGVVFVPAFAGLFAPHWRSDARGAIFGLTQHSTKAHVARGMLEAIAFQAHDVADAMASDAAAASLRLSSTALRVDGGASANALLMQLTADVLGRPVARPADVETTALGAALAVGVALNLWSGEDVFAAVHRAREDDTHFLPQRSAASRIASIARWQSAVRRTFLWTTEPPGVPSYGTPALGTLTPKLGYFAAGAAIGAAAGAVLLHRWNK